MSGFINFLKSLFSGILGLFSSKKSQEASAGSGPKSAKRASGYFLELDDAKSVSSTPAKATAKTSESKAAEPAPQKAVAAVQPAPQKAEPPKPAPVAVNAALNLPQPTVTNFATDYLLPNTNSSRRRPGANMNPFLEMARQVKSPT